MAQRSQWCARCSAAMRGQRLAKYSMAKTTYSASGRACMPAALVTTMGVSVSFSR